jgi:hypothetical protein
MTRIYSLPEASGGGSALMSAASMGAVHPNAVEAFVRIRLLLLREVVAVRSTHPEGD